MGKQCYIEQNFRAASLERIEEINGIVDEYLGDGYVLTVRQLYYQLVARDIIPNTLREYKNAAELISNGKLAGLIDWDAIEDRTRTFKGRTRWDDGAQILRSSVSSFHKDMWANQSDRVFVIVEKEALFGVLQKTCAKYDMPLLAARGYPSGTVLREFAEEDIIPASDYHGQSVRIIHLGDHDPSGIDMTRDLQDRLRLFSGNDDLYVSRIALNMRQVEEQRPPENPAKTTDSRFKAYKKAFGESSWELDALTPQYLNNILTNEVEKYIDQSLWKEVEAEIQYTKDRIEKLAENFKEYGDENSDGDEQPE